MKIRAGVPVPYPKIRGDARFITYPCYAEVKIDGEANVYAKGMLMSKASGKIRTDFHVTNLLQQIVDDDTILFGELYWGEGKAGALYDFLSHANDDHLNFTIFDAVHPSIYKAPYEDRKEWIINNILNHKLWQYHSKHIWQYHSKHIGRVAITRPLYIKSKEELDTLIAENKAKGWEGLVIKEINSVLYTDHLIEQQILWTKIKHKYTGDYEVATIDPYQERMEVLVGSRKVGVKLVNKYKPFIKVGNIVEIEHQGVLSGGGLRHPAFFGKVK